MKTFVDTGGWISVVVEVDQYHDIGVLHYEELIGRRERLFTSDYLLKVKSHWFAIVQLCLFLTIVGENQISAQGGEVAYVRTASQFVYIGNNLLEIAFKTDNGALWSFVKKDSGIDLKTERQQAWPVTWGIRLLKPDGSELLSDSNRTDSFSYWIEAIQGGIRLHLLWNNLFSD